MRLSDVMSHMNLTTYPEVALVIFLAVFAAVVWRIFRRRGAEDFAAQGALPLDDSPIVGHRTAGIQKASHEP